MLVLGGAFSNLLYQFDRLVVPGTQRFNGHWIKHGSWVNWSYFVTLLLAARMAAAPACLAELAICVSA